jgi:hypothetical protein
LIKTAAINEPRIEFNPDGSYKGLLVEPQRTNLVLRSEEFDDVYWSKLNSIVTANTDVAPDGETTADTIVGENGTSGTHGIARVAITVSSGVYVMSWFVKKSNMSWCYLRQGSSDGGSNLSRAWFNLDTGEKGGTTGSPLNSGIKSLQNGWFRISMTVNIVGPNVRPQLYIATDDLEDNFTSDGTEQLIAWGAQLEAGSTASSYIPTVASTVTRVADVVTKDLTGFVGATEATILRIFNGDKIADVYSNLEKTTYINGVAQAPVGAPIPINLSPELGHTQVLATLPTAITEAEAIALTS